MGHLWCAKVGESANQAWPARHVCVLSSPNLQLGGQVWVPAKGSSWHRSSTCYGTSQRLNYVVSTPFELGLYYYHPYFIEEESETWRASKSVEMAHNRDLKRDRAPLTVPSLHTKLLITWEDPRWHKWAISCPYRLTKSLVLAVISTHAKWL